jgi:chloride channel protein
LAETILEEVKEIRLLKTKRERIILILCSLVTGIVTGVVVATYRILLDKISIFRNNFNENMNFGKFLIGLLVFILIGVIVQFMLSKNPLIGGSGIPQVSAFLQRKLKFRWFPELFCKFWGGVLAIGAGMSMGREGPSIHLGALIGEGIDRLLKRKEVENKYLVTAGASAGLAAAFNAPLAGAIFALEELHKFFSPLMLICVLVASGGSGMMLRKIIGSGVTFEYNFHLPTETSQMKVFVITAIFCLILALGGKCFNTYLIYFQDKYKGIKLNKYVKISLFMVLAFLISIFFKDITGGGHELIEKMFDAKLPIKILAIVLVAKFLYTMICYGTGFPGGIFLPMLVIGALVGKIYGTILVTYFGIPQEFVVHFMLLGMAGYLTASVKAPITGVILIMEMTGNFSYLFMLIIVSTGTYILTELLSMEPIYEILLERLISGKKDANEKVPLESRIVTILIHVGIDSEFDNKKVKDLKLPKKILIVGIRSGGKEFIPNGETVVKSGDQLVIMTDHETAKKYSHELKERGMKMK